MVNYERSRGSMEYIDIRRDVLNMERSKYRSKLLSLLRFQLGIKGFKCLSEMALPDIE